MRSMPTSSTLEMSKFAQRGDGPDRAWLPRSDGTYFSDTNHIAGTKWWWSESSVLSTFDKTRRSNRWVWREEEVRIIRDSADAWTSKHSLKTSVSRSLTKVNTIQKDWDLKLFEGICWKKRCSWKRMSGHLPLVLQCRTHSERGGLRMPLID